MIIRLNQMIDRAKRILQNKVYDGGEASPNSLMILPANTTDNLAALERHEAMIAYDTTLDVVVVDSGAGFSPVSGGGGVSEINGQTGSVDINAGTGIVVDDSTPGSIEVSVDPLAFANTALSNIDAVTSISGDLIPAVHLNNVIGSSGQAWARIIGNDIEPLNSVRFSNVNGNVTTTNQTNTMTVQTTLGTSGVSGAVIVKSGNGVVGNTGSGTVTVTSGNANGSGSSGNLLLSTGTAPTAANRGTIIAAAKSLRLPILAANPTGSVAGDTYYNSVSNEIRNFNGTVWSAIGNGASTGLSNLTSPTSINQDLLPDGDQTRNLGTLGLAWNDITFNAMNDVTGVVAVSSALRRLYDNGGTPALEFSTSNRYMLDAIGVPGVDYGNRILLHSSGNNSILWETRRLADSGGNGSVLWDSRQLVDALGTTSCDYDIRRLYDTVGNPSIDFASDVLTLSPTAVIDMSALFVLCPRQAADPAHASLAAGAVYYNTTVNKLKMYNGTTWETVTSL